MNRKGLAVASHQKHGHNTKARPGPAKRGRGETDGAIRPKDKGSRSKAQSGSRSASAKKGRRIVEVHAEAVVPCYVDLILDIPADADDGDLGAILRDIVIHRRLQDFEEEAGEGDYAVLAVRKPNPGGRPNFVINREAGYWSVRPAQTYDG